MSRTVHHKSSRRKHAERLCFQGHLDCFLIRECMVRIGCNDQRCVITRTPIEDAARTARWRRRRDNIKTRHDD